MTRGVFQRELQSLQECLLTLGSEVGDNVVKAVDVLKHRDAIGALFNKSYRKLLSYAAANPGSYKLANYLEWALHNLERAAGRRRTRRRQNNRPVRPIYFTPTLT